MRSAFALAVCVAGVLTAAGCVQPRPIPTPEPTSSETLTVADRYPEAAGSAVGTIEELAENVLVLDTWAEGERSVVLGLDEVVPVWVGGEQRGREALSPGQSIRAFFAKNATLPPRILAVEVLSRRR